MVRMATPKIESLIDRQIRLWEVRRRLADEGGEAARRELVHLKQGPWLTVSRQVGAGGTALAERVARSLGWQVFDREIVDSISRNEPVRERILSQLDERAVGSLSDWLGHLLVPESLTRGAYLKEMMQVLWAVARQGRAVLLGRGANWLLDPPYGLRVRLIAPVDERVRSVARDRGISPERARHAVREDDAQKARFVRQVYDRDIEDPLGYDLVLNTGGLDPDTVLHVVQTTLRAKLGADVPAWPGDEKR